ncbi:MAG: peptidoglycan D,D-transpeptidase FtsI family protein [Bauldia sp.]
MRIAAEEFGGGAVLEPTWVTPRPKAAAAAAERAGSRTRIALMIGLFVVLYGTICGRLIMLGFVEATPPVYQSDAAAAISAARPDLVDRNGEILGTDIRTASLYGEPRRILDVDEAAEGIHSVLPDLSVAWLRQRLTGTGGFVWIQRELTPQQRDAIHNLGIPGLGFLPENQRFYPGGPVAAHIVGAVNVDNQGIAGIEKYIDDQGLAELQRFGFATGDGLNLEPVRLSIDLRVQHILRDELASMMERHTAEAAAGIVLDVRTGEVIAMSSLPDFDPNQPAQALDPVRLNRVTAGVFELGSVFKTFTVAMALDQNVATLDTIWDASHPLRSGGFTINDFHGKNRPLTTSEVFIYSSNIGASRMAMAAGTAAQQEFLRRIGITTRVGTELPERAGPIVPSQANWRDLTTMTISFGHGVSTTPMNLAVAAAALVNGGILYPPTLLPRTEAEASALGTRVISEDTSREMRYLFRLNVTPGSGGSGSRADVPGYLVGGKTGTAEKVVNGVYSSTQVLNSFLAAFPMDNPQYVVLVVVDDPHPEVPGGGNTAGYNAAPTVANVIRRSASILGVAPRFTPFDGATLAAY